MTVLKIAVIPGDGIGKEVVPEGAGKKFTEYERFRQVVIRAKIQSLYAIADIVLGCQDKDVSLALGSPKFLQDGEAIDFGQHEVEDDNVVLARLCVPETVFAIDSHVDRKAGIRQSFDDGQAKWRVIFNDQNAHAKVTSFVVGTDVRRIVEQDYHKRY